MLTTHLHLAMRLRMSGDLQGEYEVFPDYKHLLQENYCTLNTNIFFSNVHMTKF